MKTASILAVMLIAGLVSAASAFGQAVPRLISYQGNLMQEGQPVDGQVDITFSIYDVAEGGTALWSEPQTVTVTGGYYSVLLGSVTALPSNLFTATERYLGITIGTEAEMVPRIRIASVAYSLNADQLDGQEATDFLGDWTVSGNNVYSAVSGNVGIGTTSPSYKLTVAGNAGFNDYLYHNGDSDTYLLLSTDQLNLYAGGVRMMTADEATQDELVINENSLDVDFRVESDVDTATFFVEGSTGQVGIGTVDPFASLVAWDGSNYGMLAGAGRGVEGYVSGGMWGYIGSSTYAGNFIGDGRFTGYLTKAGGGFKIDHPLDPANKFLYHSFVESPDQKNLYDGIAVLDANGEAWVELPDWFAAVNRDFRYQLTCIGGFAPVYIAEEISDNRFKIKGDNPGMKVSWQVTGIRQDPYAKAHSWPVEEEKPYGEQGYYMHPDLYGQPEEKSLEWARDPEGMRLRRELTEMKQD